MFGFRPGLRFRDKTFKEAARELGEANIALLGVQVRGLLVLNPGDDVTLDPFSICFAIAPSENELKPHALDSTAAVGTWLPTFAANRAKVLGTAEAPYL